MPDEKGQLDFTIVPDDASELPRVYSNFCAIQNSPFDFTLTFCEMLPPTEKQLREAQTTPRREGAGQGPARRPGPDGPRPDRRPAGELPPVPAVLQPAQGPGELAALAATSTASVTDLAWPARLDWSVKERRRSILHVDLDPFFVSVERSMDPSLRGRPVVVGGDGHGLGFVAAVSAEAREAGVRVGMPLAQARRLTPDAAFRRGDLEAYGRVSDEVTAVLLAASRRVERPSADEAFVDLTPEAGGPPPVRATETIRDELQRRLGLDVSLGLASSRLAARIASTWARPRGLLVVLPGYELSFIAGKPVSMLGLPPHLESALERNGLTTLGQLAECDEARLAAIVGPAAARVRAAARGEGEPPIASPRRRPPSRRRR